MDYKIDYISRLFQRTSSKRIEHYVLTRIWHLLDNYDLKIIPQQYVFRDQSKYALTDVYFPQIGFHIEVNEPAHYDNDEKIRLDLIRENDVRQNTGHKIFTIDCREDIIGIHKQIADLISEINNAVNQKISLDTFKPWRPENEHNPNFWKTKGKIDLTIPVSFDDCKMITLKSNEITKFEMASAYKIIAKIGDCVNASASIKSNFYMTAIMGQPNQTPIDVSYCCAKKWGTYVSGSYPGSPISKSLIRTEVANKFNTFGAWDIPYHYLAQNPIMVHDWDNLYGTRFCNEVIFDNTIVKPKDRNLYDEASVSKLSASSLMISGLSNKDETITEISINDISGKIVFSGVTDQEQFTAHNLTLRKGMYIIILKTGNQLKTLKYINYE